MRQTTLSILMILLFISCKNSDDDDIKASKAEVKTIFTIDGETYQFTFDKNEDCSVGTASLEDNTLTAIASCDKGHKSTAGHCMGNYMTISFYGDKEGVYPGIDTNNNGLPESSLSFWQNGKIVYMSPVNDKNSTLTILHYGTKGDYVIGTFRGELLDVEKTNELSSTVLVSATAEFKAYILK